MAATPEEIARLRRMTAEPDDSHGYTDAVLAATIERYPLLDADGLGPDSEWWAEAYDLNAAAADVWSEKAAALVSQFDFNSDGASFTRSQQHAQAAKQQRYYAARRAPGTLTLISQADTVAWDEGDIPEEA
jgi:1,2-phenylacetyl-CoA epoxidase PaaB subunit